MIRRFFRKFPWTCILALSISLRLAGELFPGLIEYGYFRGLYTFLRILFDYTLGLTGIPLFYILPPGIPLYLILRSRKRKREILRRIIPEFLSAMAVLFLWMWGFNYARLSVSEKIGLDLLELNTTYLCSEAESLAVKLNGLRSQEEFRIPEDMPSADVEAILDELELGSPGSPTTVRLYPKGLLMRLGISGIYIPFTMQGQLDGGLHHLELTFVSAHEHAHAYGITNEGEANFIAWLSHLNSDDPYLNYAGMLEEWRHLTMNIYRLDSNRLSAVQKLLSEPVRQDLREIKSVRKSYPALFPALSIMVNDWYLKLQGVEGGFRSYSRFLNLVRAWKELQGKRQKLPSNNE